MQDWQQAALHKAIEAIYDTAFAPDAWPQTLATISQALNAEGALIIYQHVDGRFDAVNSPGVLEALRVRVAAEGWMNRDLRAIRSLEAGVFGTTDTVTDQDLATPEEIETHPYYTELLAPLGLGWFIGSSVSPDASVNVGISIHRFKHKPIFSSEERDTVRLIARHAERSLRLSTRLFRAELSNLALGQALENVGCGVLLLDEVGKVVFVNKAGSSLTGADTGDPSHVLLWRTSSAIRNAMQEQISATLAAPFETHTGMSARPILISSDPNGSTSIAYVLPVSSGARQVLYGFGSSVSVIILILSNEAHAPADPSIVRDIFGLTLGEARIASLVGAGRSPREAADALGLSEETARTVLKRVFSKTNISKQSQLVSLLTRLTLRN
jgi:DNA-binding CsgD family transcriptional regulator/PAS domain-containing protein